MQWFVMTGLLQGASGVGYGNFMEIGPLDPELKPRATTWLAKADLLFVVSNLIQSNPILLQLCCTALHCTAIDHG